MRIEGIKDLEIPDRTTEFKTFNPDYTLNNLFRVQIAAISSTSDNFDAQGGDPCLRVKIIVEHLILLRIELSSRKPNA
jgi:hypothetical protein